MVREKLALLWRAIRHWEFWPYYLFYTPVYVQLLIRGVLAGSLGRFTCANPGMAFGGLLEYSKWEILSQLPDRMIPPTAIVEAGTDVDTALAECRKAGITFPIYAKPDRGERGLLVTRVTSREALEKYLAKSRALMAAWEKAGLDVAAERLLLQAEARGDMEFGVLYQRLPGDPSGSVTSIVKKELIAVNGDGTLSLGELIDRGERTRLHRYALRREFHDRLQWVPAAGESVPMVEVGNHVRGATFLDATALATDALVRVFDRIADGMRGFCIGRFDLKCEDEAALEAGDFQVVEVNGVNSEPAHIYDPDNQLLRAYRDLLRHWRVVHRIGQIQAGNGCVPPSGRELVAALVRHGTRRRVAAAYE